MIGRLCRLQQASKKKRFSAEIHNTAKRMPLDITQTACGNGYTGATSNIHRVSRLDEGKRFILETPIDGFIKYVR